MKKVNTMSGMFGHMQHMVSKGMVDLDDFYNVSYYRNRIVLLGRYSSDKISDYKEFWTFSINDVNGFVEGQLDIDGVEVKIVLT